MMHNDEISLSGTKEVLAPEPGRSRSYEAIQAVGDPDSLRLHSAFRGWHEGPSCAYEDEQGTWSVRGGRLVFDRAQHAPATGRELSRVRYRYKNGSGKVEGVLVAVLGGDAAQAASALLVDEGLQAA